jgi:hypothetical protein
MAEINQTKCWIATHGWEWMEDYYDTLPATARRRLRDSPYNLCPACLLTKFAPKVSARYPKYSHEKVLLLSIEVMELLARRAQEKAGG